MAPGNLDGGRSGGLELAVMDDDQWAQFAQGRRMAGAIIDEVKQFRFEVWAYAPMTEGEIQYSFRVWRGREGRRNSLKNQTIRLLSNHGLAP